MTYTTKDSGERRDFGTGSRRDVDTGKPLINRIPLLVRERLGALYRRGAEKYADATDPVENWKKGQPLLTYLESLHRHLLEVERGNEDEDHEAAVLWNMASFMWTKQAIRDGRLPNFLADTYNAVVAEFPWSQPVYRSPAPDIQAALGGFRQQAQMFPQYPPQFLINGERRVDTLTEAGSC